MVKISAQKIWFARNWLPAWMGLMKRWSSDTNLSEFNFNPSWFSSTLEMRFLRGIFRKKSRSPSLSWGSIRDSILLSETKCMICITHLGFGFQKRSIRFRHILCNTYTVSKEENTFCWLNTILRKIWKAPVDKSIDHVPYCFAGACKVHCEREHQQATMEGNYGKLFVPLRHDDKVPFIIWTQIQGFPFN